MSATTLRKSSCCTPTDHCWIIGVVKSAAVPIRARTGSAPRAPPLGFENETPAPVNVARLLKGGLVKPFCSKMPTSGWS
jgi:hypothetical protein